MELTTGVPSFKAAASGNASNEVLVALPSDPEVTAIIHRTVERVLKHGPAFEAIIMDRERGNPKFKFLFENEVGIGRGVEDCSKWIM